MGLASQLKQGQAVAPPAANVQYASLGQQPGVYPPPAGHVPGQTPYGAAPYPPPAGQMPGQSPYGANPYPPSGGQIPNGSTPYQPPANQAYRPPQNVAYGAPGVQPYTTPGSQTPYGQSNPQAPYGQPASFPGQSQAARPPTGQAYPPPATQPAAYPNQQAYAPPGQAAYPAPSQQPGAYTAPGGYAPQQGPADFNSILNNVIRTNNLTQFYGNPQALAPVLQKLSTVNFAAMAAQWRISQDVCQRLAALSLYDIIVFCDDSGSMAFEEYGSRIDDLKMILERISQVATQFDDDGILIRFFNSSLEGNGIRNAQEVTNLITQVNFSGMTPIGTQLEQKILQPFFFNAVERRQFRKPLLVYIITDGEPSGESRDKLLQVCNRVLQISQQSGFGPGAVSLQLAQVGKDEGAQRFLSSIDNNSVVKDIVDTTSYYELEAEEVARKGGVLTPELWLIKLMLGAIDPYYDNKD